jgi:hypothetical protein
MRRNLLLVLFMFSVLPAVDALTQIPALPDNALTKWVVGGPKEAFWRFEGVHPLVKGVILGPSTFQFGYDLIGGAYRK